ncbi:D-aminoacyl-tRNA deacylase [Thiomicrorhabdus indica]|uniref:D-aminoacyl-tRNA deacylase n=1 Tax=Thiomicrorhabdus indica TaxID=2267253 RepID=UPI00102D9C46|nr:D-aminoacyl-tRNA deacylase [Thiomicrorhabdus indica]
MICLIQRVSQAHVSVENQIIGQIEHGILALVGFQPDDTSDKIHKMLHKLLHYRIFADENDKMNLNVQQVFGGLLLVPQFTLAADTQSGLRPSFSTSAPPAMATKLFDELVQKAQLNYSNIATGQFGADMKVNLTNDGPVTFYFEI